jgi:hypothetical protein
MQKFLMANKVLLFGLAGAIAMTVQQYTSSGPVDYKVLALAALVAGIGFLAKNLRGQWATILGSLLPVLGVLFTNVQGHTAISWSYVFSSAALAIAGVFAPPTKSLSYEQSPAIVQAKQQAAVTDAAQSKTPPVGK